MIEVLITKFLTRASKRQTFLHLIQIRSNTNVPLKFVFVWLPNKRVQCFGWGRHDWHVGKIIFGRKIVFTYSLDFACFHFYRPHFGLITVNKIISASDFQHMAFPVRKCASPEKCCCLVGKYQFEKFYYRHLIAINFNAIFNQRRLI